MDLDEASCPFPSPLPPTRTRTAERPRPEHLTPKRPLEACRRRCIRNARALFPLGAPAMVPRGSLSLHFAKSAALEQGARQAILCGRAGAPRLLGVGLLRVALRPDPREVSPLSHPLPFALVQPSGQPQPPLSWKACLARIRELLVRHATSISVAHMPKAPGGPPPQLPLSDDWDWEPRSAAQAIWAAYTGARREKRPTTSRCPKSRVTPGSMLPPPSRDPPCSGQVLKEPPYYLEAWVDLWPSAWFLAGALGWTLPAWWQGRTDPLAFKSSRDLGGRPNSRAVRYHRLRDGGRETQADLICVRSAPRRHRSGLDLGKLEAQAAILKALKLRRAHTVHETAWQPMRLPAAAAQSAGRF